MFMIIQKGECEILKDINLSNELSCNKETHQESFSLVGEGSLIGGEPCFFNRPHSYSVKVRSPELTVLTMEYDIFFARMKEMTKEITTYISERCKWMELREELIKKSKDALNSAMKEEINNGIKKDSAEQPEISLSHASQLNKKKMLISIKRKANGNFLISKDSQKYIEQTKECTDTEKLKERVSQILKRQFNNHDSKPLTLRSSLESDSPFARRKNSNGLTLTALSTFTLPTSTPRVLTRTPMKSMASSPKITSPLMSPKCNTFRSSTALKASPRRVDLTASPFSTFEAQIEKYRLAFHTIDGRARASSPFNTHFQGKNTFHLFPMEVIKQEKLVLHK